MFIRLYFILQIILLSILLNLPIFAQKTLNIKEVVKIALENNYSIKIAKSEAKISSNDYGYGLYSLLPHLDATGRINNSTQNVQQEFLDGRKVDRDGAKSNSYEGNIGLNWTIFDGMKMFINYNKLGELKGIGELKLKSNVENTIKEVTVYYFSLIKISKHIKILKENLEISRKRYEFIQNKFEVGTASKSELLLAGVDLNSDISDSIEVQISYDNTKSELERLLNYEIDSNINLSDSISISGKFSLKNEIDELSNNTDVIITSKMIDLTQYDIDALKADYYPRLSLYSNFNYNRQESEAGFLSSNTSNGYSYGVNLSFNLFDGLNTSRQIENAKVNRIIAEDMLNELSSRIKQLIIITTNNYNKYSDLSNFEKENTKSAKENLEIAMESLNLGLISPIQFREVQKQFADSQLRLLTSEFNAKINSIELDRLTGRILKNY